jgi:hypothetical protein
MIIYKVRSSAYPITVAMALGADTINGIKRRDPITIHAVGTPVKSDPTVSYFKALQPSLWASKATCVADACRQLEERYPGAEPPDGWDFDLVCWGDGTTRITTYLVVEGEDLDLKQKEFKRQFDLMFADATPEENQQFLDQLKERFKGHEPRDNRPEDPFEDSTEA